MLNSDAQIYRKFPETITIVVDNISDLFSSFDQRQVDILHVLARIDSPDTIHGESRSAFLQELAKLQPKILISASGNDPRVLVPFFSNPAFLKMNLVLTLKRNGDLFPKYFQRLFDLMLEGRSMPEAWVVQSPQVPSDGHAAPETIFSAGYGSLMLSMDQ